VGHFREDRRGETVGGARRLAVEMSSRPHRLLRSQRLARGVVAAPVQLTVDFGVVPLLVKDREAAVRRYRDLHRVMTGAGFGNFEIRSQQVAGRIEAGGPDESSVAPNHHEVSLAIVADAGA
jgi:hypothetical protein